MRKMNKLLFFVMLILLTSFTFAVDELDYQTDAIMSNTNCVMFGGYSITNANDGISNEPQEPANDVFSNGCAEDGFYEYALDDNFTITNITFLRIDDGAGGDSDYTINISVDGTDIFSNLLIEGSIPIGQNNVTLLNGTNFTAVNGDNIRFTFFNIAGGIFIDEVIIRGDLTFAVNNFSISLINKWNSSALPDFNATMTSGLTILNFSANATQTSITTTLLENDSRLWNITISKTDYFSNVSLNVNISTNLVPSVFQSVIQVFVNRSFINDQVTNFFVNDSIQGLIGNTTGNNITVFPNTGNYNFTVFDNTGVENFTMDNGTFDVSTLDNKSILLTVIGHFINVRVFNILDGGAINVFNATLTGLNFTDVRTLNTITGLISFPVVDGTYSVSVDAENFSLFNNTQTALIDNTKQNVSLNFTLYTTNSVNITFRNIDTNALLLGTNVTIEFIGSTAQTNSTNTSSLFVDLLIPSEYTLISNADGFRQNSYIISVSDRSFQNITIFLTPENDTQLVLIKVRDEFNSPVRNGIVTIQRYINDEWRTDQILKTDFNGQTEGYYVISTEFYNHLVSISGTTVFGIVNSNANKKVIYAEDVTNGITITANLLEDSSLPAFQNTEGNISINLTYTEITNSTGTFTYRVIDNNGLQHDYRLKVTKGGELESVCDLTTSTTSSAIITCPVNETGRRTVYVASGFVDAFIKDTLTVVIGEKSGRQINWGVTGYILAFFVLVVIYFSYLASPTMSLWLGTIFFIGFAVSGVIFDGMSYGVMMILIVLTWLVANMKSQSGVNA